MGLGRAAADFMICVERTARIPLRESNHRHAATAPHTSQNHADVRSKMRVIHDERAAAFYALGHARARSGSCACVVTTSGTAVANLLPAACEADRDSIPIVFATADRPAEMRGVGADQVLERQQDLLRSTVRRAADLPPADDRIAALGDLGEVSSIAAAALREEDPVSTRRRK